MKLIVYMLSAFLLFSCVSAGGSPTKQDVDISELQADSNLQDALKYGINWVFEQAAKKYDISNLDIEVTQVNKIQKWKQSGSTYYYFDVEASNDYAYINSTYNVKCNSKGVLSVVNKWIYTIDRKDDEPSDGGYDDENEVEYDTNVEIDIEYDGGEEEEEEEDNDQCEEGKEVDASQIKKDSALKKAVYYGLNWIFEKAAEKFNISEVGIELTEVNIICKWQENGYTYYYFDVEAVNCDNVTVNATYNVRRNSRTGELRVVNKWDYDINFNSQCKKVDLSAIGKNTELKKSLIYGLTWIFQKAADKFDISESGIAVTKINSICSYKEGGYVYYSFDLEATNEDEDVVKTTYNVRYETKTGKLRVVNEWKYNIDFNDDEEADDCEDQGYDTYNDGYDVEVDLEVEIDLENITYQD